MPDTLHPRSQNDEEILPRKMLSRQVKEFIVDAILNGTYKAGDRIVEMTLAKQLGVSQAPVREAIHELVVMGFLETEPYKGTSVRIFSSDELHEVYTVRAALESLAGRQAAIRITDDDLAELQAILDEMLEAAYQNNVHLMVQKNNLFRDTILKISGNKLLCKLYNALQFADWTIFSTSRSRKGLVFLAQRHEILLTALATHDPDVAAEAMRNHIEELDSPSELVQDDTVINFPDTGMLYSTNQNDGIATKPKET
jgi:DNA-binding GntR family transcriptional regulator